MVGGGEGNQLSLAEKKIILRDQWAFSQAGFYGSLANHRQMIGYQRFIVNKHLLEMKAEGGWG